MDRKAAARWCSRNLFASRLDTAVTVCLVPLVIWAAWVLLSWAIGKAQWHVVADNFRVLMVGAFPSSMMERAWISFALFSLLTGATLSALTLPSRQVAFAGVSIATLCAVAMALASNSSIRWTLAGLSSAAAGYAAAGLVSRLSRLLGWLWGAGLLAIGAVLVPAGVDKWGGLLLSLVVTLLASVLSVPIGVALAFGRRSRYSSLRILCTGYIEVMRSLPLILVVYWVWLITPLFLSEATVSDLWRGLLGFSIFFAAYVAEYVRSGLQSVPRGQIEAARSLGMTPLQVNRDVVLPQATRVVMPALVGNVLDIFNTVPLLFIIGLTDFLRAGQMVLVNPQSSNSTYEIYAFMFAVYLAIASLITYQSRRIEARMALASR